jgi:hypothetical protein
MAYDTFIDKRQGVNGRKLMVPVSENGHVITSAIFPDSAQASVNEGNSVNGGMSSNPAYPGFPSLCSFFLIKLCIPRIS